MSTENKKLAVLYTNDVHSHFENMPNIASAIRQLRDKHSRGATLVVDCGDHMDRMRMETEGSGGRANVEVMNVTGYDAVVVGNNEGLTFVPAQLGEMYARHAKFAVLGTNVVEIDSGKRPSWMVPQLVVNKNGLSIGIIGVTIDFNTFYKMIGLQILDPFQAVAETVSQLRGRVDLIFVLSHLGLNKDRELARRVEGIDGIFGGHTHHLLEKPLVENGTIICAAGYKGEFVGELVLEYDPASGRIVHAEGTCHPISKFPEDPGVLSVIDTFQQESARVLEQKVTELKESLPIDWGGESVLGNLLADGIRDWTKADIGIVNAGQFVGGLNAGNITLRHLLEICPSPINPCRMLLSGERIKVALEEALLPEYKMMPIRGFGFRGKVLGSLCLSGIDVIYDPDKPPYQKIRSVLVGGKPLDLDAEYVVGTIDMFTFGIGYQSLKDGRNVRFFLPEFLRDILRERLSSRSIFQEAIVRSKQVHWTASS